MLTVGCVVLVCPGRSPPPRVQGGQHVLHQALLDRVHTAADALWGPGHDRTQAGCPWRAGCPWTQAGCLGWTVLVCICSERRVPYVVAHTGGSLSVCWLGEMAAAHAWFAFTAGAGRSMQLQCGACVLRTSSMYTSGARLGVERMSSAAIVASRARLAGATRCRHADRQSTQLSWPLAQPRRQLAQPRQR